MTNTFRPFFSAPPDAAAAEELELLVPALDEVAAADDVEADDELLEPDEPHAAIPRAVTAATTTLPDRPK